MRTGRTIARPVALPRGTRLDVVAYYDNSAGNPSNPFHPPRRVRYGIRSDAEMLGCHAHEVARMGMRWTGPDGRAITLAQIAGATGGLEAEARFESDPVFGSGAYAAVVEVDRETGALHVRRLAAVDDAGTIINPLVADGQVHGGVATGAGQALFEEMAYDADGNPVTGTFVSYLFPSAAELPPIERIEMVTPTPINPLGAKGIGESGTIGATPAVHNAVVDALAHLGVRHVDMPASGERVWRAIREASGAPA